MVTKSPPAVILYGLNEQGEPRAAHFDELQAKSALRLADKMGLNVLRITTAEHSALATQLEPGKLFLSGEGSIPKVSHELYEKIIQVGSPSPAPESQDVQPADHVDASAGPVAEAAAAQTAEQAPSASEPQVEARSPASPPQAVVTITGYPRGWDSIEIGSLVLAQASVEDGWWEAIVIEHEQDLFTLRWRDYPKEPKLVRHRLAIALLAPIV